jgi:hypothetical protein
MCVRVCVHLNSVAELLLHKSMLASLPQLHCCNHKMLCQLHNPATKACLAASCSSLFRLSLGPDRSCLLQADEVSYLLLLFCRQADLAGAGGAGRAP